MAAPIAGESGGSRERSVMEECAEEGVVPAVDRVAALCLREWA